MHVPILTPAKTYFSKAAWAAYNTYRQGLHYRQRFAKMEARLNGRRDAIEQFQWERIRRLLRHAYETTPYYRNLFDSSRCSPDDIEHPADLQQIPTLEKSVLRTRLDDFISEMFPRTKLKRNATGGSSGTPVVFYQDYSYWNQRNLSVYYFDRWAGWDFGGRQLILWGSLPDAEKARNLGDRLNNYWRNYRWLNGFNMTEETMIAAFKKMQRWRPQTILAYASSLYLLAKYFQQNKLAPGWKLKGVISSAEMLYPHYREIAEEILEAKVYNRYGSREVGIIAMECKSGRMHINCNDLYLEIDSDDPYTQPGEIIITQLNNYGMPFIRYRIGDIGRLSDEVCPCGNSLPILEDLMGRTTATFRTKDGRLIHGGYFTQQFYGIQTVNQFQLIQENYNRCTLKLVVNEGFTKDILNWLVGKIKEALGPEVEVVADFVEEIPRPSSGKMAFTISKVGDQENGACSFDSTLERGPFNGTH